MSEKKHKCTFDGCNTSYSKEIRLKIHLRKHTGERPFVCDYDNCEKTFTNAAHLRRHKSLTHERSEEVLCTINSCNISFNNRYSLKKHQIRSHRDEIYAFKCAICLQGFEKKKFLAQHLYLHTGKAPYSCTTCQSYFSNERDFKKHIRGHKTYTCECGQTFTKWSLICAHKRNDCKNLKQYKCDNCGKTFLNQSNLNLHLRTHVDEAEREILNCPYENCERIYYHKRNLTYHINVFHKKIQMAVKCTEIGCDQTFKSNKNLKQHILRMHSSNKKEKKKREIRKDKGVRKKCIASVLTGVKLDAKEHSQIIEKSTDETNQKQIFNKKVRDDSYDDLLLKSCDNTLKKLEQLINVC